MAEIYQKSEKEMVDDFLEILKNPQTIKQQELLSLHTTFRIGGPADFFLEPQTEEQLLAIIDYCMQWKIPYVLLGKGSNLLVSDRGFRGVVITLEKYFREITRNAIVFSDGKEAFDKKEENGTVCKVTAKAGISLSRLAAYAAEHSLEGLEFASGIPGTLGGAVVMNAGAYDGEISKVLVNARILFSGNIRNYSNQELQFGYRHSILMEQKGIVLSADFILKKGNRETIREKMANFNQRRREKQPLEYPSAGSTFKRPKGYFAGKLIEDAGLKGYRVGEMEVSKKHSGFVINTGHGTAKQALQLIRDVQRIVLEKYHVILEPEVQLLGFTEEEIKKR